MSKMNSGTIFLNNPAISPAIIVPTELPTNKNSKAIITTIGPNG